MAEVADKVKQDEEVIQVLAIMTAVCIQCMHPFVQVKKNVELQKQMEALDLQKQEAVTKEHEIMEAIAKELESVKNVRVV